MFPFSSMPMMPISFPPVQPTAEQTAAMQRITLQYQQQQLLQLQQQVAQYSKSIEEALAQIKEALTKKPGDKAIDSATAQATALAQNFSQNQAQNQALNQGQQQWLRSNALKHDPYRFDPQRADFRQDFQGGMGDFGRPVF